MNYTTYAAVLIRSHLFSNPPMPPKELSRLEGGLAQVSAIAGSLRQIAQVVGQEGLDPQLASQLTAAARDDFAGGSGHETTFAAATKSVIFARCLPRYSS